jgi:hypothetical protein
MYETLPDKSSFSTEITPFHGTHPEMAIKWER